MCLKLDALYSIFHCFSARLTSQCDVTELSADVSHVSLLFEHPETSNQNIAFRSQ